jgi:predicted acyl esterase
MIHGWGGSKTDFEATDPHDNNGYNNVAFAKRGYAVLNYTARGFGGSCGGGPSGDHTGDCGQGYIRLADSRYEARDTQYLLGLLADEKIVKPKRIGVTGISYGGGQSTELAFLHNKIRKPSGKLAPWRSPEGVRMSIAAAYPRWPWSDLIDALIPNGHFLDTDVAAKEESLDPPGAPIQSYVGGLFALGSATGYYCGGAPASTPCTDDDSNLPRNFAFLTAGDFLSPDAQAAFHETYADKAGYPLRFVKGSSKPAPLLIQNGFTDDLFPPEQALRVYNYVRSRYRHFPASLQFGDLGHSRGANEDNVNNLFVRQGVKFFGHWLKGAGRAPASGSVTTFDETCPNGGTDAGPYRAKSWPAIHTKSLAFGTQGGQTFSSAGGNSTVAAAFDPIGGTSDSCKTIDVTPESNTATYTKTAKKPVHMMGMTTIKAHFSATGETAATPGEIVGRLWDIDPDAGTQRLIDRGVYTFTDNPGNVTFQLHGNGYTFAKGHTIELQLLGADAPYYRPANGAFSVTVSKLTASLPLLTAGG